MEKKETKVKFEHFLDFFPEATLPIALSEDTHHIFSEENKPLPKAVIEQFIVPIEKENIDEFTEFIACFSIPATHDFHAVVYWKAALLNYEYVMATFTKKGELINRAIIAGTNSQDDSLVRSVATIEEDWIIYMVRGVTTSDLKTFDPASSQSVSLELLPDGKIV